MCQGVGYDYVRIIGLHVSVVLNTSILTWNTSIVLNTSHEDLPSTTILSEKNHRSFALRPSYVRHAVTIIWCKI